jgi:hypothetical protein
MIFKISKASDSYLEKPKTIEINSIEDLKKIDDENNNCGLIITFNKNSGEEEYPTIVVYDDYVE